MTDSNLEQLIAAWLDGCIDAAASEALQQGLRGSAKARETFQNYAQLDAVLLELEKSEQAFDAVIQRLRAVVLECVIKEFTTENA